MGEPEKMMEGDIPARTFDYQDSLPKLPIPSLEQTCETYLKTVAPLQTENEQEDTKEAVRKFLEEGDGPNLQAKLEQYATGKLSFFEEFWYDAYLETDGSVVLNLNPFFVLEDDPTPTRNNQISRAASLIISSVKFVEALRKETMEPDVWRGTPLCMYQFQRLFGCCRVPNVTKDSFVVDTSSRHIVVLCRSQFYWFDVLWQDGSVAITERDISHNLRSIQEDASAMKPVEVATSAVGVLTTNSRRTWAKHRAILQGLNAEALAVVDRALFLVCLDDTAPPTAEAFAATALHGTYSVENGIQTGTCTNRWYDKLQIVVCENGVAGVNFEHSSVDGHTVLRFVSDIFTDTIIRFAQSIRVGTRSLFSSEYRSPEESSDPNRPDIGPKKLEWKLNSEIKTGIRYAESKLSDLILQNEVKVLEFQSYGKNFIVKHNMSPDAFIQMAFIAAYYSLYGELVNVYEPVLTKRFLHGRTEAARSVTAEAATFARTFCSEAPPLDKLNTLRLAIKAQVALVKRCAKGHGVDRHLYALHCIFQREALDTENPSIPSLFKDGGWEKLNHTVLSTSNCGNPSLRLFGFGPVVPNGFGIGYIIKDEGIQFCAASKHRQTERFLNTLHVYLLEVHELLSGEQQSVFPHLSRRHQPSWLHQTYGFFDAGLTSNTEEKPSVQPVGRRL